jgi:hypothetical protein
MNLLKLILLLILILFQGNCADSIKNKNTIVHPVNNFNEQEKKVKIMETKK